MFLRSVFLALLAFGAASIELEAANALPRNPVGSATVQHQREQPPSAATISLTCNDGRGNITTYTLSVGHGRCDSNAIPIRHESATSASCRGDNSDSAQAGCDVGCTSTSGNGSCTATTTKG